MTKSRGQYSQCGEALRLPQQSRSTRISLSTWNILRTVVLGILLDLYSLSATSSVTGLVSIGDPNVRL